MDADNSKTLTKDELDCIKSTLTDLVALERDRELGHTSEELHRDPVEVLRDADDALEALGFDPSEVIWKDDREKLGLVKVNNNQEGEKNAI